MKKVLLTAMALVTMASASVFGMYGVDGNDWIGFLTHGNQLRARMDQLGFVLGNGTIKGTFGVRADTGWMGRIIGTSPNTMADAFIPTVSAGIGYTSDMFGIGVGYNFTYIDSYIQVHTPVVVFNALNNNLRLAVPIQVAVSDKVGHALADGAIQDIGEMTGGNKAKFTGVGFNQMELRYFTGIDAFNLIRLDVSYKNLALEQKDMNMKGVYEDLHLQLRLYFLNTQVGNVTVNPFLRIDYATLLKGGQSQARFDKFTTIGDGARNLGLYEWDGQENHYSVKPYYVKITPVLSLAASSDIVSLYFEPSIGYKYAYNKVRATGVETKEHALTWGAYAEMYVTPVKDLEWYFEMDVNGDVNGSSAVANSQLTPVYFETTTGLTWYLPSLGGDTAQ